MTQDIPWLHDSKRSSAQHQRQWAHLSRHCQLASVAANWGHRRIRSPYTRSTPPANRLTQSGKQCGLSFHFWCVSISSVIATGRRSEYFYQISGRFWMTTDVTRGLGWPQSRGMDFQAIGRVGYGRSRIGNKWQ